MTALVLAVLAALTAAAVPIYLGRLKPGYSHVRHTLSELGEQGSPVARAVSVYGMATGLFTWGFAYFAAQEAPHVSREVFLMIVLVGGGYVGGSIFPCDKDAPAFGSWRTGLHNIFAGFMYVGATGAFFTMARDFGSSLSNVLEGAGYIVLFGFFGCSFPNPYRGLAQRIVEIIIFGGMVVMAWWIHRGAMPIGEP